MTFTPASIIMCQAHTMTFTPASVIVSGSHNDLHAFHLKPVLNWADFCGLFVEPEKRSANIVGF